MFDASSTIESFNPNNATFENSTSLDIENRKWEYIGNSHLGANYGSFFYTEANYSNLPKLLTCKNQYIMVDIKTNVVYPIGHQGEVNWMKKNAMHCIAHQKSVTRMLDFSLKDRKKILAPLELPFSLESLLSITADRNKTIVLTVAGYSYKDMLMSWVCRLRKLSIENFIVSALDQETYQISILQVCSLNFSCNKLLKASHTFCYGREFRFSKIL